MQGIQGISPQVTEGFGVTYCFARKTAELAGKQQGISEFTVQLSHDETRIAFIQFPQKLLSKFFNEAKQSRQSSSRLRLSLDQGSSCGSLAGAVANLRKQRIFPGSSADAEIHLVELRETIAFHAFPHASLIIVYGGEVGVSGDIWHKELHSLTAALAATIKF